MHGVGFSLHDRIDMYGEQNIRKVHTVFRKAPPPHTHTHTANALTYCEGKTVFRI